MGSQESTLLLIKLIFAALAVVAVIYFLVRPVVKTLRTKPDVDFLMGRQIDLGLPEDEQELQIPNDGKPDRMAMINEARSDPRRTATMIAAWLKEKK